MMAKKVAETLASIDIVVLHRLRVLAGGRNRPVGTL
jgi:hypothetical protein